MNEQFLQIDVSNSKYQTEEDLVQIQLSNENIVEVNFSKLVSQSKYFRDKYKYSEILETIQSEIEYLKNKLQINTESIEYFFQLLQDKKSKIPIKHYKDIYTLSEYFQVTKLITELDDISRKELFNNLNFSIQILIDTEQFSEERETNLTKQIENFLSERVNECIENSKFKELPISTIYRILKKSDNKSINSNSLFEFIIESSNTRYFLFKFLDIQNMREDLFNKFIEFIEEQDEETKEKFSEFIPFNLNLIKNMKNKYDQLFKKLNQTKEELNETENKLNDTKEELNETKEKLNKTKEELTESNDKLIKTAEELSKAKEELNQIKIKYDHLNEDLEKCQKQIEQDKNEINKNTNEILVGGFDENYRLGEQPNNKNKDGDPIISPPVNLIFNPSSILSFSSYFHSVAVTRGGCLMGAGDNRSGRISSSLPKTTIDHFTEFCIKDNNGHNIVPVSAVCTGHSTLYMYTKSDSIRRQLVLCDEEIKGGTPIFLNIGNHEPVSLFGGKFHSAAIGVNGEVIFINSYSIKNSPSSRIEAISLPDGEKASSVACCDDSVVVLSSNG